MEKYQWVACAVVQVRSACDSNLPSDMVWAVDPGEESGDERPVHIEDKEHRFCMCVILYLVYFLYFTQGAEYYTQQLGIILSS